MNNRLRWHIRIVLEFLVSQSVISTTWLLIVCNCLRNWKPR